MSIRRSTRVYYERRRRNGGSYTAEEWRQVKRAAGGRCLRCGKKGPLTADHVIPVSLGGTSNIDNIQPLCRRCNSVKGSRTWDYRPTRRGWIIFVLIILEVLGMIALTALINLS